MDHEMALFKMKMQFECDDKNREERVLSKQLEEQLRKELKEVREAYDQYRSEKEVQERAMTEFNDIESVEKKLEQLGGVPESKKQALLVQGKQCWNTMQEMECAPNNG